MNTIEELASSFANKTAWTCRYDPRFIYHLYYPRQAGTQYERLIVLVHGTERRPEQLLNRFKGFARGTGSVLLAPLFPAGFPGEDDVENHCFLRYGGIAYDDILLHMVDEARRRVSIRAPRFYLYGFSAGGQFAHRFFYLHPQRLRAVSIGAPGRVTLLDETRDWPEGIADACHLFGQAVDLAALRKVPAQVVIGELDSEPVLDNNRVKTRLADSERLYQSCLRHGIAARWDVVPAAGHQGLEILAAVDEFFKAEISKGEAHGQDDG